MDNLFKKIGEAIDNFFNRENITETERSFVRENLDLFVHEERKTQEESIKDLQATLGEYTPKNKKPRSG